MWGNKKKKDWEVEVENILKEARLDKRYKAFFSQFDQLADEPPQEWQDVFTKSLAVWLGVVAN